MSFVSIRIMRSRDLSDSKNLGEYARCPQVCDEWITKRGLIHNKSELQLFVQLGLLMCQWITSCYKEFVPTSS